MATQKNIQMKSWNNVDWDTLFPKTKAYIVSTEDGSNVQEKINEIVVALDGAVTQQDIDNAIASLIDTAPETLDTLNELANALGDDPNFATTIANQMGTKVDKVAGKQLSTNDFTNALKAKLEGVDYVKLSPTEPTAKGFWFEEI